MTRATGAGSTFDALEERAIGCSSDRRSIATRRDAELAYEGAGHVALVCEARQMRSFGRRPACREMPANEPNPELDEIGVRCRSSFADESAEELEPADIG